MSVQSFNKSTTVTTFTMRIQQVYIRTVLAITHQWWYYMPFRVVYHTHCVFIIIHTFQDWFCDDACHHSDGHGLPAGVPLGLALEHWRGEGVRSSTPRTRQLRERVIYYIYAT